LQAVLQDDYQSLPFEIQSLSLEGAKPNPSSATGGSDPLELFNLLPQSVQNDSATAGFQLATQHLTAISSMSYGLLKERLVHISKAISAASPLERLRFWSRLDYRLQTQYGAGATQGALNFLWRLDTMLTQAKLNANSKLEGYVAASDTEQYRSFRHEFLLESISRGIAMQGYSSPGFEWQNPDWGLGLAVGSGVLLVVETGGIGLIMGGEGLMGAGLAFNSARVFGYGMKSVAAGSRLLPSARVAVVAAGGAAAGNSSSPVIDRLLTRTNNELPGSAGVLLNGRPSVQELANLTETYGVEFGVVYRMGSGKNGGGGTYHLFSGNESRVPLPGGPRTIIIAHTHPANTPIPSRADMLSLRLVSDAGSPQIRSMIVLRNGNVVFFDGYGAVNGVMNGGISGLDASIINTWRQQNGKGL
jgi:hypothetical protein